MFVLFIIYYFLFTVHTRIFIFLLSLCMSICVLVCLFSLMYLCPSASLHLCYLSVCLSVFPLLRSRTYTHFEREHLSYTVVYIRLFVGVSVYVLFMSSLITYINQANKRTVFIYLLSYLCQSPSLILLSLAQNVNPK